MSTDTRWYTPDNSRYTFTRRPDGKVVVATVGTKNVIDVFRDERGIDYIAKQWLAEWA